MNYLIDTGEIFHDLKQECSQFSPELLNEIKEALYYTLVSHDVITTIDDDAYRERFTRDYELDTEKAKNEHFGVPDYFPRWKGGKIVGYLAYDDECVVSKEATFFDLFFALKLYFLEPMKIQDFLDYHLESSFSANRVAFNGYVRQLFIVYSFLNEKTKTLTELFFETQQEKSEKGSGATESEANISDIAKEENLIEQLPIFENKDETNTQEYTLPRQFLAIYFLLRALSVYDKQGQPTITPPTPILDFVKLLTGKSRDNIGKLVRSPFKGYDKKTESDLRFIRPYFRRLNLDTIVAEIDKELRDEGSV